MNGELSIDRRILHGSEVTFRYAPLGNTKLLDALRDVTELYLIFVIALLYAREIIPRPPSPPRTSIAPVLSSSNNTRNQQATPGPSNSKVKTEKVTSATNSDQPESSSAGKKRTSDQAGIIELSSEEEDDDDISALDPVERAAFIRMKVCMFLCLFSQPLHLLRTTIRSVSFRESLPRHASRRRRE